MNSEEPESVVLDDKEYFGMHHDDVIRMFKLGVFAIIICVGIYVGRKADQTLIENARDIGEKYDSGKLDDGIKLKRMD